MNGWDRFRYAIDHDPTFKHFLKTQAQKKQPHQNIAMKSHKTNRKQFNAIQEPLIAQLTIEQLQAEIDQFTAQPGNSIHCQETQKHNLNSLREQVSDIRWLLRDDPYNNTPGKP